MARVVRRRRLSEQPLPGGMPEELPRVETEPALSVSEVLDQVTGKAMSAKQIISIGEANARQNLWVGSVRSGKTYASLFRFVMDVANAPEKGEIIIVGKTLQSIFRNCIGELMKMDFLGDVSELVHGTMGSAYISILGRRVHVVGAADAKAESKIRGMTVCLAYIDELTLIPEEFYNMLVSRMSVAGAKLHMTTNPDSPNHWVRKRLILGSLPGDEFRSWSFTLDDNRNFIDPAYYYSTKRTYSGLWYRRFILGEWVSANGAVFDLWDENRFVLKGEPPTIAKWFGVGMDYGIQDPTVALLGGVGTDGVIYILDEYRNGGADGQIRRSDVEHSAAVKDWLAGSRAHDLSVPVFLDPSASSIRVQMKQDGFRVAMASNKIVPGIQLMTSLFASDKMKIHPNCAGLLEEIPGYVWDKAKSEQGVDLPVDEANHSIDALRYLVNSSKSIWRPYVGVLSVDLDVSGRNDEESEDHEQQMAA